MLVTSGHLRDIAQRCGCAGRQGVVDERAVAELAVGVAAPALDCTVGEQGAAVLGAGRYGDDEPRQRVDMHRKREVDRLAEPDVPVVVAVDQQDGRPPSVYPGDGRRPPCQARRRGAW